MAPVVRCVLVLGRIVGDVDHLACPGIDGQPVVGGPVRLDELRLDLERRARRELVGQLRHQRHAVHVHVVVVAVVVGFPEHHPVKELAVLRDRAGGIDARVVAVKDARLERDRGEGRRERALRDLVLDAARAAVRREEDRGGALDDLEAVIDGAVQGGTLRRGEAVHIVGVSRETADVHATRGPVEGAVLAAADILEHVAHHRRVQGGDERVVQHLHRLGQLGVVDRDAG